MRHTVIAWDSSYRDFFHLIDGLQNQEYNSEDFELIYVEQRSKEFANEYAESEGVDSLWDVKEQKQIGFDFSVEYLGEDPSIPYHVGRCVNRGIEMARGEFISVMDGDMLLPPDFLDALDHFHSDGPAIANIVRRAASGPVGVSKENWRDGVIDYELCLDMCPNKGGPIPDEAPNYAPLISADKEYWEAINGYSNHIIWSTECTMDGTDVTRRLEMASGGKSQPLPETVAVHPWHPVGFNRSAFDSRKFYRIQQQLIKWTLDHEVVDWMDRLKYTEQMYEDNKNFVDDFTGREPLRLPGRADMSNPTFLDKLAAEASTIRAEYAFGDTGVWTYLKSKARRKLRSIQGA